MPRKGIRSASVFDRHHGIERYTIGFALAISLLTSGFVVSQVNFNHLQYEELMKVDGAGSTATFSKTKNVILTLGKMRLSSNRKTAYVPFTFSTTDNVGIHAKDYRFYVTDASKKPMKYKVRGNFIMYGTTGRGVLVLQSPTRIVNEPLVLFIINQKHVQTINNNDEDNTMANASTDDVNFGKYDVAPFKINPGAIDVQQHRRVDTDPTDLIAVYEQLFGSGDISQIHKRIESDKKAIRKNQEAASALRERLEDAGYEVPKNPDCLKNSWRPGDTINIKTGKTADGHNALTYSVSDNSNADKLTKLDPNNDYPNTLKNKDGTTTSDAAKSNSGNTNADVSSSSTSSNTSSNAANQIGGTATDPGQQWQQLVQAWETIFELKRDIYVTQYQQLYRIRHQERHVTQHSTIGPMKSVKQVGKVEVDK